MSSDKEKVLDVINLTKKKIDETIKGGPYESGSKQRQYLSEEESIASPTLSVEKLLFILVIYPYEERDFATFDVPGAYLHADIIMGKTIILKLWGIFVDIMCDINPEHKAKVRYKRFKKVLYLCVLRAIYV